VPAHSHPFPVVRAYFGSIKSSSKSDVIFHSVEKLNDHVSRVKAINQSGDSQELYFFNSQQFVKGHHYLIKIYPMRIKETWKSNSEKSTLLNFIADFTHHKKLDLVNQKINMPWVTEEFA